MRQQTATGTDRAERSSEPSRAAQGPSEPIEWRFDSIRFDSRCLCVRACVRFVCVRVACNAYRIPGGTSRCTNEQTTAVSRRDRRTDPSGQPYRGTAAHLLAQPAGLHACASCSARIGWYDCSCVCQLTIFSLGTDEHTQQGRRQRTEKGKGQASRQRSQRSQPHHSYVLLSTSTPALSHLRTSS